MRFALALLPTLFLAIPTVAEDFTYVSTTLSGSKGTLPACTPVMPALKGQKVVLRDPNEVWGKVKLSKPGFEKLPRHEGFDQCVAEIAAYKDRYLPEHLLALSKGELAAGMPFEFALMILGPPNQRPTTISMMNPLTGKPETYKTYIWMHIFGSMGALRTAFSIIGGAALGVAGATSSLSTATDALSVANAAATAELVTWQVSDFSDSQFVTIQVTSDNQIHLLMAQ